MCAVHVRVCVLARLPIWRLAQQPSYNYKFTLTHTHTHTHTLKDRINEVGWFMQHYMSFSCVCVCACVCVCVCVCVCSSVSAPCQDNDRWFQENRWIPPLPMTRAVRMNLRLCIFTPLYWFLFLLWGSFYLSPHSSSPVPAPSLHLWHDARNYILNGPHIYRCLRLWSA